MDFVFGFVMFALAYFVSMWILTAVARRHMFRRSLASVDATLMRCDSKFTSFFWKRVDGPGDLNVQYRFNLPIRGQKAPVVSVSAEPATDGPGTDVEVWMSSWTSLYGIANGGERVTFSKWSLARAIRHLNRELADMDQAGEQQVS